MSSETDKHLALRDPPASQPAAESDESESEKQTADQPAVPPPPPNGGLTAWLQVAGAFFLFFNSW